MKVVMKRAVAVAIGLAVGVAAASVWLLAQGPGIGANLSRSLDEMERMLLDSRAEAQRERILEVLADEDCAAWCGAYRWSSGFEHYKLYMSPTEFFYEYSHCTGTGHLAIGAVGESTTGRLRLEVSSEAFDSDQQRSEIDFSDDLLSIPWGAARFIVSVKSLPDFCASVMRRPDADRLEYASYLHLLPPGQHSWGMPQLDGLPTLPAEFEHLLSE